MKTLLAPIIFIQIFRTAVLYDLTDTNRNYSADYQNEEGHGHWDFRWGLDTSWQKLVPNWQELVPNWQKLVPKWQDWIPKLNPDCCSTCNCRPTTRYYPTTHYYPTTTRRYPTTTTYRTTTRRTRPTYPTTQPTPPTIEPTPPTTQPTPPTTQPTPPTTPPTTQETTTQLPCCPYPNNCPPIVINCRPCPPPDFIDKPPVDDNMPLVVNPTYEDEPIKFAATIVTNSQPRCSASIISQHFALSQCLNCLESCGDSLPPSGIEVWLPEYSGTHGNGIGFNVYGVQRVVIHPRCLFKGKYDMRYDLGIVQTADTIEYGTDVAPAKIPRPAGYQLNTNKNLIITTLQLQNTKATTPREALWIVKVRAVDQAICSLVLNQSFYKPLRTYCTAYHHRDGRDGCVADFGAPLSLGDLLVGVLIHKFSCGAAGSAASFVNVAASNEWLKATVQTLSNGTESV